MGWDMGLKFVSNEFSSYVYWETFPHRKVGSKVNMCTTRPFWKGPIRSQRLNNRKRPSNVQSQEGFTSSQQQNHMLLHCVVLLSYLITTLEDCDSQLGEYHFLFVIWTRIWLSPNLAAQPSNYFTTAANSNRDDGWCTCVKFSACQKEVWVSRETPPFPSDVLKFFPLSSPLFIRVLQFVDSREGKGQNYCLTVVGHQGARVLTVGVGGVGAWQRWREFRH